MADIQQFCATKWIIEHHGEPIHCINIKHAISVLNKLVPEVHFTISKFYELSSNRASKKNLKALEKHNIVVRKIKIGKMSIPERGSVVCLNDTDVDCSPVVSNNDNILSSNDVLENFN
jgi:hypothetical protein